MCHKLRSIYKKQPHHVKKNQLHSHFSCKNFQHTSSTILHATQHCWNLDTIFIDTLVCMDSPMFLKLFIQKHFKINTFKSTKTMCCLSNFYFKLKTNLYSGKLSYFLWTDINTSNADADFLSGGSSGSDSDFSTFNFNAIY